MPSIPEPLLDDCPGEELPSIGDSVPIGHLRSAGRFRHQSLWNGGFVIRPGIHLPRISTSMSIASASGGGEM